MTIKYAQIFCTVADLIEDMQSPGAGEAGLYNFIKQASDYLQKTIGWFIPVTLTRTLHGHGSPRLFVPPLLGITSITDYNGGLLTAVDYLTRPESRFWPNGPYALLIVAPNAIHLGAWADREDGVQIAGQWGLYDLSKDIGATVQDNPQSNSQTTLIVANGAKISLGADLLIESEQELVSGWEAPVDSTANLDGAIAASDSGIKFNDATKINIGEIIRIDLEKMRIRDINATTREASVARGWDNTEAAAHVNGSDVYVYRTATVERGVNGTTAASHLQNTAISRYQVPDDILFLIKETATLMLNKAKSQYQGRTGNEEGVIFYNDAFSKPDLERVKAAYLIKRFR